MIITYNADKQEYEKVTAKQKAQSELLRAMKSAYTKVMNDKSYSLQKLTLVEKKLVFQQMDKQVMDVERLFGMESPVMQRIVKD